MHFLCVTHDDATKPGLALVGDAILEQGHAIEIWDFDREQRLPPDALGYDGYVFHGGAQNVGDGQWPWLVDEEALIKAALAAGKPILGICLGAQLLAHALGGEVTRLASPEIGWHEVRTTDAAQEDPLFDSFPRRFRACHYHYYHFTCPPQATLLAENDACHQAFRVGAAWGVQFHPEVTPGILHRWAQEGWGGFSAGALADYPDTPEERQTLEHWNRLGHRLSESWLAQAALVQTA
jgi:GMP synthase (glutamine-hydrolysing)